MFRRALLSHGENTERIELRHRSADVGCLDINLRAFFVLLEVSQMKVVFFCGGFELRLRDYADHFRTPTVSLRLSPDFVARYEVFFPFPAQGLYPLSRLQG